MTRLAPWVLALGLTAALYGCAEAESTAPQNLPHRGALLGNVALRLQVADDEAERAKGLMFVARMPENEGMLFVWPDAAPRHFWMRNTLIPLDLLFLREGKVVHVLPWAKPLDETALPSGEPADSVVEVNGGWALRHGVGVGDELRLAE